MGVRPLFLTHNAVRRWCLPRKSRHSSKFPGSAQRWIRLRQTRSLRLRFPLAPRTPFKDIFVLQPAHVLIADSEGVAIRRYWHLHYPELGGRPLDGRSERDIAEELSDLLLDATRIRLRSDVSVGAYLSGGLDLSIVAAAVKSIVPDRLGTFSVTFDLPDFDESDYQNEMARALRTEHPSIKVSGQAIARSFPSVIGHTECPILRYFDLHPCSLINSAPCC